MNAQDYCPNQVDVQVTALTNWSLVATDGTGYTSYAALVAASKTPFPGPVTDFPTGVPKLRISIDNGSGAAGAGCYFAFNRNAVPVTPDFLIVAGDAEFKEITKPIKLVWVKMVTSGDKVNISGNY